jgi:hypothetical protein
MSTTTKVARPSTPNLDLLSALHENVFRPAGAQKLASVNQVPNNIEELDQALTVGQNVARFVEAKAAAVNRVSPVLAHANKVAKALGMPNNEQDVYADQVNAQIDANPALAQKFAAALGQ